MGNKPVVYCSRRCHALTNIAGKDSHLRWISVKEQLPQKAGYNDCKEYYIWVNYCNGYETKAYWMNEKWVSHHDLPLQYYPTHWMEKPRPPKEFRKKMEDKND